MPEPYSYRASIKSNVSDELINTILIRPLAGLIVRLLYRTPVTPNQVTIAAILAGLSSAFFYAQGGASSTAAAGLLIALKDILDSADGQLARAKNQYSRAGRFLDSIGDFIVNCFVFAAIGWSLFRSTEDPVVFFWAVLGLAGITLRVSFHVFSIVSYLHLEGKYEKNRIIEEITEEDRQGDAATLRLQQMFVAIYGWQDRLMLRIDDWCRGRALREEFRGRWYGDRISLRLSGFLGFGTELFVLTVFSLFNDLEMYLFVNMIVMNGIMAASIAYRRWGLRTQLQA